MERSLDDKYLNKIRNNLDIMGLSFEDFRKFKYAGGDKSSHLKYFKILFGNQKLPEHEDECLCGHTIQKNCFVVNENNEKLLVLGNCCIKRFLPKSGRTCEKCGEPHRNSTCNLCNKCKIIHKRIKKIILKKHLDYIIMDKIYVNISYKSRELAKPYVLFDPDEKKYYLRKQNDIDKFEKVFLNVKYDEKENVKALGGLWDADVKKWYAYAYDTELIEKYCA
jgi:hypothetical protein